MSDKVNKFLDEIINYIVKINIFLLVNTSFGVSLKIYYKNVKK